MSKKRGANYRKLHRLRVKAARLQARISRLENRLTRQNDVYRSTDGNVGAWPESYWRRKR